MMPDYKNWIPFAMVAGLFAGAALALASSVVLAATDLFLHGAAKMTASVVIGAAGTVLLLLAIWMAALHRVFDYNGSRKLSKTIIDGTAGYISLPEGGLGLDVGCGSGALTIACAKRNPGAYMVGCDIWGGPYKAEFSKELCEKNAVAEGVANVRFQMGDAVRLPFEDESFDAVTSNYVYHNIVGTDKQKLLLETLRVLKKGGRFAIHDLMSKSRYGDMDGFVRKLKEQGYSEVRLIDTAGGIFIDRKEAVWLGLGSSALLTGVK